MASGSNVPSFDDILKRGSVSDSKYKRPVPHIRKLSHDNDLSLTSAVKAARDSKKRPVIPTVSATMKVCSNTKQYIHLPL